MAEDIALNATTHDLEISEYDLLGVGGVDEVAQHLRVALRLFQGEWYLDEFAGIPYYRDVLVSAPDVRYVESLFRREILSTPEVERLADFSMTYDRSARTLTATFEAVSSEGTVAASEVF